MNKTKLIIIGSIIVIAGVGGYFGYQWYKKNKKKKEEENTGSGSQDSGSSSSSSSSTSVSSPTSSSTSTSTSFSFPSNWTTKEGNAFRQWVIANHPDYAKQISLDASGSLNEYVDKAYKAYGTTYLNSLKPFYFKKGDKVKVKNATQNVGKMTKTGSGWKGTGNVMNLSLYDTYTVADYATFSDGNRYVIIAPVGTTASFIPTSESNLIKI